MVVTRDGIFDPQTGRRLSEEEVVRAYRAVALDEHCDRVDARHRRRRRLACAPPLRALEAGERESHDAPRTCRLAAGFEPRA
jgi:hypothetical protein